jgi:acetoin:2,6-dichlorophenolindophenol oxidoreductase subunit beta
VEDYTVPFGVASIRRPGTDITVVAMQAMLNKALSAAEKLAGEGIQLEVIDPKTLVPLDIETIVESVKRTNRLLISHEAVERAGWAGEIAMQVMQHAFDFLAAPISRVCGKNVPMPYSASLENVVIPSEEDLMAAARSMMTEW